MGETQEKYVTITINKKLLGPMMEGLAQYKSKLGTTSTDRQEAKKISSIVDEMTLVKHELNKETKKGKFAFRNQETLDNPVGKQEGST
jgi:hypothetical protein